MLLTGWGRGPTFRAFTAFCVALLGLLKAVPFLGYCGDRGRSSLGFALRGHTLRHLVSKTLAQPS